MLYVLAMKLGLCLT